MSYSKPDNYFLEKTAEICSIPAVMIRGTWRLQLRFHRYFLSRGAKLPQLLQNLTNEFPLISPLASSL